VVLLVVEEEGVRQVLLLVVPQGVPQEMVVVCQFLALAPLVFVVEKYKVVD
jgi:hypothetical protein